MKKDYLKYLQESLNAQASTDQQNAMALNGANGMTMTTDANSDWDMYLAGKVPTPPMVVPRVPSYFDHSWEL